MLSKMNGYDKRWIRKMPNALKMLRHVKGRGLERRLGVVPELLRGKAC